MLDMHSQMILNEYKENLESFKIISTVVKKQLEQYVNEFGTIVNSVETRVKTLKSLTGKLNLKGYKYATLQDITDIVGARVVTFYSDEVDKFAAMVEKNFDIDWDNSVDKRKIYNVDQFGYMSVHYICRIPKSMYFDPAHPLVNEYRFEIQLRSVLQHTWATIYHDTGYKNDVEVPKEYLRNLNQLAGLLDLADDLFVQIRTSIDSYRRRIKQLVNSGNLEEVELNIDSFNAFIENGGFYAINERISTINNMEVEEANLRSFLKVFKAFGFNTLKDLADFVTEYSDLAYEFAVRQFSSTDLDIMTTVIGPLTLCVVYVISNGMGEQVIERVLNAIYGVRKSNANQARRLMKIGVSMGLVKSGGEDGK